MCNIFQGMTLSNISNTKVTYKVTEGDCHWDHSIHTDKYQCMRDSLPRKVCVRGSRDIFKYWEMSDNILKTVPERCIYNGRQYKS